MYKMEEKETKETGEFNVLITFRGFQVTDAKLKAKTSTQNTTFIIWFHWLLMVAHNFTYDDIFYLFNCVHENMKNAKI